jgi:hypothetical protein
MKSSSLKYYFMLLMCTVHFATSNNLDLLDESLGKQLFFEEKSLKPFLQYMKAQGCADFFMWMFMQLEDAEELMPLELQEFMNIQRLRTMIIFAEISSKYFSTLTHSSKEETLSSQDELANYKKHLQELTKKTDTDIYTIKKDLIKALHEKEGEFNNRPNIRNALVTWRLVVEALVQ